MDAKKADGLKRVIGVPALAATIINNTIGAGIYLLPAAVCLKMGASGILGYFFCGAMLVTIMLCYTEIGSKVTGSGGSYIYVETAFGPFPGFIVNCLFFFGWGALGTAALINALADSLAVLLPIFSNPVTRGVLFLVLLGLMVFINIRSAKLSVKLLQYITVIKLLPLLAVILIGFNHIKVSNLQWQQWPPVKTLGETALILFFAFAGFETSLNVSGEVKDPRRTIPRGIILGAGIVFIIYILLQTITQGVLGGQVGKFANAPLAAVAGNVIGPVGATILITGAVFSCMGNISGDILATPRLLFAGAKDGLFPKYLAKVHPKFATPYVSVITYALIIFVFALTGEFKDLAVLASCSLLVIYLGVILAMLKLRTKDIGTGKTFRVPGGLTIPGIAIAAILWLLANLSKNEFKASGIFITVICLIYLAIMLFKKMKTKPLLPAN